MRQNSEKYLLNHTHLDDVGVGMIPKAGAMKQKKLDFIKIKNISAKDTGKRIKKQATDMKKKKKTLLNIHLILVSKMY